MVVDVVVFGATGFTGAYVVNECLKRSGFSFAIAGRNAERCRAVLERFGGGSRNVPVLTADVADAASLRAMAKQAKVVINCVGPFRLYGEAVVRACIAERTHYVDICGEPNFMEKTHFDLHDEARAAGIVVCSGCGFDCIPADMGALFTAEQFRREGGRCASIESFLSAEAPNGFVAHFATFESAVLGFGNRHELKRYRRSGERPAYVGPKMPVKDGPFFEKRVGRYCFKFPGADASVVRNTQRTMAEPVQYAAYFTVSSAFWAVAVMLVATVFGVLANFAAGRRLLLAFPGFFTLGAFSHAGPTQKQIETTRFRMEMIGAGYSDAKETGGKPDRIIRTCVSGPEPGYDATVKIVLQTALCLLARRHTERSGVLTPGAVFHGEGLIDRLQAVGILFESDAQ